METISRRGLLGYAAALGLPASLAAKVTEPQTPRVRQNIQRFMQDAAKVRALRAGVGQMKTYSMANADDPRGWNYWSSIHGRTSPPPAALAKIYSQCDHTSNSHLAQHFLSWHRAYLLFFEATIQAAARVGGETTVFQLPYWNWYADGDLPMVFTTGDETTNPLWHLRAATSLDPTALDQEFFTQTALIPASLTTWRQSFSVPLEMNPHGSVHGVIGGDMGSIQTSARDPIFWLHHANIDRLWTTWIKQGRGQSNPSPTSAWGVAAFTFDTAAIMKKAASGVTDSEAMLFYRYDDYAISPQVGAVAAAPSRPVRLVPGVPVEEAAIATMPGDPMVQAVSRAAQIVLRNDIVAVDLQVTPSNQRRLAAFAAIATPDRPKVWVDIIDVVVSPAAKAGGFSYSIVATLPVKGAREVVLAEINTFSLPLLQSGHDAHAHGGPVKGPVTLRLPLADVLAALGVRDASRLTKGIRILFKPTQPLNQTVVTDPVTVGAVSISTLTE